MDTRGLQRRHRGKGESGAMIETRVRMERRMAVRVRIRVKARMEVEWVASICLVEINK
jgi:hypothetical protein